jgi:membrane AbrB-like protein
MALLASGTVGALAGQALGIPAGIMVGALLVSGLYRLMGGQRLAADQLEPWRRRYGRVGRLLFGTVIGAAFGPDVITPLKAALQPMVVLVIAMICVGLALGWILSRLTQLDLATAIISAIPGGIPAMAAIAEDVGADPTVVTAIHFSRLTTILVAVPLLIRLLTGTGSEPGLVVSQGEPVGLGAIVGALVLGCLGGLLAVRARIPTADLVGPILVVGGLNLLGAGLGPLPAGFRQAAMLFIGTAIGAQVTRKSLRKLRGVALPAAIMIVAFITVGLLLGWGLSRVTPLDLVSALLSGVPGGASALAIVAHELGGDMRLVAALHLTRQLAVLVLVPSLLSYLLRGRHRDKFVVTNPPARG